MTQSSYCMYRPTCRYGLHIAIFTVSRLGKIVVSLDSSENENGFPILLVMTSAITIPQEESIQSVVTKLTGKLCIQMLSFHANELKYKHQRLPEFYYWIHKEK